MRASAILFSLFVAGAISSPVKREIVYDEVVVYQTITISDNGSTTSSSSRRHRPNKTYSVTSTSPSFTPAAASVTPAVEPTSSTSPSFTPAATSVTPAAEPTSATPLPSVTPSVTPQPKTQPPPSTTPTPAQPTASPESDGSPLSDGTSLLETANYWRDQYGLPHFTWDSQLEKNALKTGTDGRGQNQVHQLNPGTMAQVITPGMVVKYGGDLGGDTPFDLSYCAWLCEVPSQTLKAGGVDQCKLVSDNLHMSYSDTGHYDILTSKSYSKIGCAFADNPDTDNNTPYQGLWVCDLGY